MEIAPIAPFNAEYGAEDMRLRPTVVVLRVKRIVGQLLVRNDRQSSVGERLPDDRIMRHPR